jgi:hypothetical protein
VTGEHHHGSPPSAAGELHPYGTRVTLRGTNHIVAVEPLLMALLEGLAADCLASGATLIGHLKCLLHLPAATLACNLTSLGRGASCRRGSGEDEYVLEPGQGARIDMAVLVYGLPAATIEALVLERLHRALDPEDVAWSLEAEAGAGHPSCSPGRP